MNIDKWLAVVATIAYLIGFSSILLLAPAFWNAVVGEAGLTVIFVFTLLMIYFGSKLSEHRPDSSES